LESNYLIFFGIYLAAVMSSSHIYSSSFLVDFFALSSVNGAYR